MTLISWITVLILCKFVQSQNGDGDQDVWEDPHMFCPNQCVCQQSPFTELSISRWIQELRRENDDHLKRNADNTYHKTIFNEAFFEDDKTHLLNSNVKFVMCILQNDENAKDLVVSLPQDLHALVLIHNGDANYNSTVFSTDLQPLSDLQILEIRSTGSDRNLVFFVDEPLPTIKYANFESINLISDERIKKLIKSQRPSESYGGRLAYRNDESPEVVEEFEIVPYDVYKMELTKSMRPSFFGWNNLEVLRIHNCHLDEVEWEMFAGLDALQHLSLENNGIKVVPAFAFYGALNLKTLSLARNVILDLNYMGLAGLLELEYLDLSSNNLTKLSEESFPPFTNLKKLDLQNNPIEFVLPMTFAILNTTKELVLGSKSTALDLANTNGAFISLNQLQSLNLLNVKTPSLYQTIFSGLKEVVRLRLKGSVKRIEYDAFVEMPHLKELILSDCGIFDISMDAFFGSKNLRFIDLSKNQLSIIPNGLFDEQKQLHEIYLQNNHLKKLPKGFFAMESLKLVRLTENPWKCSCDMSEWNQGVTNSIRLNKISADDRNCIRNPKTGKIEYCDEEFDDFPTYSYGFDNKMSPMCSGKLGSKKTKNVFYFIRHNSKCSTTKLAGKKIMKNKAEFTLQKHRNSNALVVNDDTQTQKSWISEDSTSQLTRKNQSDSKIKRLISNNVQIIDEQVMSNDVAYDL